MWSLLAKILARPRVTDWLIRRALRTPYTHIEKDGDVYMERYWLFNPYPADSSGKGKLLPSVRLHKIMRPDQDRHMHDHPWNARTIILRGWYTEDRLMDIRMSDDHTSTATFLRHRGLTACLRFGEFHQITDISPGGVWTLFITWKYRGTWGFLVDGRKVPWRRYLGLE